MDKPSSDLLTKTTASMTTQEADALAKVTHDLHMAYTELHCANDTITHQEESIKQLQSELAALQQSISWRVTKPLRLIVTTFKLLKYAFSLRLIKRVAKMILQGNIRENWQKYQELKKQYGEHTIVELVKFWSQPSKDRYPEWVKKYDSLTHTDRQMIKSHINAFKTYPVISIIMPVYNVEGKWLRMAIESVMNQLYPHWELCIADDASTQPHIKPLLESYAAKDSRIKLTLREQNGHISEASNSALTLATGEFIGLLDHDDMLAPHALYYVALELNQHPQANLIYSDEDKVNYQNERFSHYFKPDWNIELFLGQNVFNHFGVYRRSLIDEIGGFRKGFEGSQDYDLCLRALSQCQGEHVYHIPRILYHWRAITSSTAYSADAKHYTEDAAFKAKQAYLNQHYPGAQIELTPQGVYHRVKWPLSDPAPSVSIIIPTRNAYALIKSCVESLLKYTDYPNYEIVIVDNQSDEKQVLQYFDVLGTQNKARIISYDKPFNFSAINNAAVAECESDYVLFLNNDIEIYKGDWLSEMVSQALRQQVGVVGAKLYHEDRTIQHAGIILGMGNANYPAVAGHGFFGLSENDYGYVGRAILTQEVSAVTGACMLVARDLFTEIGQFDEENLAVAFNDVDLCLRVREAGQKVIWTPFAELLHHESATRGYEDTPEKIARFEQETDYMKTRWGTQLEIDPFHNPNLCLLPFREYTPAFPPRLEKPWIVFHNATINQNLTSDESDESIASKADCQAA